MRICICHHSKSQYSETFIRAHIDRLPGEKAVLYGNWFPTCQENGRALMALPLRVAHRAAERVPSRFGRALGDLPSRSLARFLRRHSIEVVLAEYGQTGASVLDACLKAGVPIVVHFHGFDAYHQAVLTSFNRYERLFAGAAFVIAVSQDMEKQLLTLGCKEEKIVYNPCGSDSELFSGCAAECAPPTFLAVGRFVDKKAPHLTLLALKRVLEAHDQARLVMMGDGPLLEACKGLTRALGISGAVEFLGARPHEEVARGMAGARCFVQHSIRTSYGDSEGTPVGIIEAGMAGLPVVATNHGGIPDVVVQGRTGFLVDEGDIEGMALRMLALAMDPELAGRMGREARAHVRANFSMEKSIGRLSEVLEAAARKGIG